MRGFLLKVLITSTCAWGSASCGPKQTGAPEAETPPTEEPVAEEPAGAQVESGDRPAPTAALPGRADAEAEKSQDDAIQKSQREGRQPDAVSGEFPGKAEPSESERSEAEPESSEADLSPEELPLPQETKVLHVGDSFAGALGIPLGHLLEEAGVRSVLKHEDASYLTSWAWGKELRKYLWRYNPDLVIVTLGANELGIANPQRRKRTVRKIVSTIGDRPCLWVAIPLWQGEQNGLMDVIEESASPCVFYDTNELLDVEKMPRIQDGIHPTTSARKDWAQKVLQWLKAHREPQGDEVWHLSP